MGIGFMDFLEDIEDKVKEKSAKGYVRKEYDFNDDAKEVALDPDCIATERSRSSGSEQSGFDEVESYGQEMEDEASEEGEFEVKENISENRESDESEIEDDINPDEAISDSPSSDVEESGEDE